MFLTDVQQMLCIVYNILCTIYDHNIGKHFMQQGFTYTYCVSNSARKHMASTGNLVTRSLTKTKQNF